MSSFLRSSVKSAPKRFCSLFSRQITTSSALQSCEPPPYWIRYHDNEDSRAAVRGEHLLPNYKHGPDICTIHAIRHNDAFARSEAVVKHCETSEDKRYARARNARLIMSNEIPDIATDDVRPYCFWHPNTASEETYRQLAKRYPEMAYSVGRACAVAGYDRLYHELDILPEISIAEEARAASAKPGSKSIFDHIMRLPVCYAVLDDYTRSVNHQNPRSPALMNGDTAVRSTLDVAISMIAYDGYKESCCDYFDIAEDGHISEYSNSWFLSLLPGRLAPEYLEPFYTPLTSHLPTINKDPLIVMAAYEGNLDRYLRLRRPRMVEQKNGAVLRGIYHNTTFAKWWSLQDNEGWDIRAAVLARFIMVNDLSHITETSPDPDKVPGMIWWPLMPAEETLEVLAERRPDMHLQVAMACIAGNYRPLWDKLAPEPCRQLWEQAQPDASTRNYFVDYLERRAAELGMDVANLHAQDGTRADDQCWDAAKPDKEPTDTFLSSGIHLSGSLGYPESESIYGGNDEQANVAGWELTMCSSKEVLARIREPHSGVWLYREKNDVQLTTPETPRQAATEIDSMRGVASSCKALVVPRSQMSLTVQEIMSMEVST